MVVHVHADGYETLPELLIKLEAHMVQLTADSEDSCVNRARASVLDDCREAARSKAGIFTLTVPTGGGKTLASLMFALAHAVANGQQRVIYAIPFTSIVEQTADIFRSILGTENVLEHHSNHAGRKVIYGEFFVRSKILHPWGFAERRSYFCQILQREYIGAARQSICDVFARC